MAEYVLDHHLAGERARLALMSRLLDPMHRRHLDAARRRSGRPCARGRLRQRLDLGLARPARRPSRQGGRRRSRPVAGRRVGAQPRAAKGDICAGPIEPGGFDLVTARAVLHHVADAEAAIRNLAASLAPGGRILLIEPDFLPVSVAQPPEVRAFWDGWLAWSREQGIDYHIGRTLAPRLAALGLEQVAGTAETAVYNGGSPWAAYWIDTVTELRPRLVGRGQARPPAHRPASSPSCADPRWWTQTIAFTAVHARAPGE